jgi:hypothetical protein
LLLFRHNATAGVHHQLSTIAPIETVPHLIDLTEALSHLQQLNQAPSGSMFIITGAGMSHPSIKLASEIIEDCKSETQKWGRQGDTDAKGSLANYSRWLQLAFNDPTERRNYFKGLIEGKPISKSNFRLAHLLATAHSGSRPHRIDTVVTVNFDDQIEKALNLLNCRFAVADHPAIVDRLHAVADRPKIVHVHGSVDFYDMCNLGGEISARSGSSRPGSNLMRQWFRDVLRSKSAIVIGYSGWEGDVLMSTLKDCLIPEPNLAHQVYWFCHKRTSVDLLPGWLKESPRVTLVVPSSSPSYDASDSYEVATNAQESVLPGDQILLSMIEGFGVDMPRFLSDPVEMLLEQIRRDLGANMDSDLYGHQMNKLQPALVEAARAFRETFTTSPVDRAQQLVILGKHETALGLIVGISAPLSSKECDDVLSVVKTISFDEGVSPQVSLRAVDHGIQLIDSQQNPTADQVHCLGILRFRRAAHLSQLGQVDEAIDAFGLHIKKTGNSVNEGDLIRVLKSRNERAWLKAIRIPTLERRKEALAEAIGELEEVRTDMGVNGRDGILQRQMAARRLASIHVWLNDVTSAINTLESVVNEYGSCNDDLVKQQQAECRVDLFRYRIRKAREEQTLSYSWNALRDSMDDLIAVCEGHERIEMRRCAEEVLFSKSIVECELGNAGWAQGMLPEIIKRTTLRADIPSIALWAKACIEYGNLLRGPSGKVKSAIDYYERVIGRLGKRQESSLREQVRRAFIMLFEVAARARDEVSAKSLVDRSAEVDGIVSEIQKHSLVNDAFRSMQWFDAWVAK